MNAKRVFKIAGGLLILIIVGYIAKYFINYEQQKTTLQQKMKYYLDASYERDFKVGKPFLTGNEGFGYNMWIAEVYPTDEPELKFHIAWGKNDLSPYQDSYLVTKRSAQGKAEISQYLKEVYGQDVPLTYKLSETAKDLERLDHDELLTKHGDTVVFELFYYVFTDTFDKQAESEKAFKVLKKYVLDNHPKYYVFVVDYISSQYKDEFNKGFKSDQQKFLATYDSEKLFKENKLLNRLNLNETSQKSSPNDLINKFKY